MSLKLSPPSDALAFRVAESQSATFSAVWLSLVPQYDFETADTGERTIYLQYRNVDGEESSWFSQSIFVDPYVDGPGAFAIDGGAVATGDGVLHLTFAPPQTAVTMAVATRPFDSQNTETNWLALTPAMDLQVAGTGSKTVYVKFRDEEGVEGPVLVRSIFYDPFPVIGGAGIVVDGGNASTDQTDVAVSFGGLPQITQMRYALTPNAVDGASWEAFSATRNATLPAAAGTYKVYVQYRTATGEESPLYFDEIEKTVAVSAGTTTGTGASTTGSTTSTGASTSTSTTGSTTSTSTSSGSSTTTTGSSTTTGGTGTGTTGGTGTTSTTGGTGTTSTTGGTGTSTTTSGGSTTTGTSTGGSSTTGVGTTTGSTT
jgi:hypothetical protein